MRQQQLEGYTCQGILSIGHDGITQRAQLQSHPECASVWFKRKRPSTSEAIDHWICSTVVTHSSEVLTLLNVNLVRGRNYATILDRWRLLASPSPRPLWMSSFALCLSVPLPGTVQWMPIRTGGRGTVLQYTIGTNMFMFSSSEL